MPAIVNTMTDGWEIFDGDPELLCYCKCKEQYQSHVKSIYELGSGKRRLVSRKPCPSCGRHDTIRRAEGPPPDLGVEIPEAPR